MTRRAWTSLLPLALLLAAPSALAQSAPQPGGRPAMTPPPLHHESVAFDSARERLVVFGGALPARPGEVVRFDATWEWNGREWLGGADDPSGPGRRHAVGIGYDAGAKRIVLYGGIRSTGPNTPEVPLCDTWLYDGRAWSRVTSAQCVTTRAFSNPVYDSARGVLLLVEGPPDVREAPRPIRIWKWQGGDWVLADSSGPRWQNAEVAAYDRARSVLVVPVMYGPDAGVWEWNGQSWRKAASERPAGRGFYGLTYDPGRQRVVLVGGRTETESPAGGESRILHQDVWTWDGARWTEMTISGPDKPSARGWARLVANPATGSLLYFGGVDATGVSQELWELDRSGTWHRQVENDRAASANCSSATITRHPDQ